MAFGKSENDVWCCNEVPTPFLLMLYIRSLELVTIPSGCQHIGRNAFQNCFSLKVLKLPYTLWLFDKVWLGLPEQTKIEYIF